jgi:hypothetical protein
MFDNGTEFTGGEFKELLDSYGIKAMLMVWTAKSPQCSSLGSQEGIQLGNLVLAQSPSFQPRHAFLQSNPRWLECSASGMQQTHQGIKQERKQLPYCKKLCRKQSSSNTVRSRRQPEMSKPTRGPYRMTKVYNNGTITIDQGLFWKQSTFDTSNLIIIDEKEVCKMLFLFPTPFFLGENDMQYIQRMSHLVTQYIELQKRK